MAIVYSRVAMLAQNILEGACGGAIQGLTNTVVQLLVGYAGAAVPGTTSGATSEGLLTDLAFHNPNTTTTFVQFFDVAAVGGVTLGTTASTVSYAIPPGDGVLQLNQTFTNGLAFASTTTASNSTAAAQLVNVGFAYL